MKRQPAPKHRFKLIEFTNPRTGTGSWRVSGIKLDGKRVRENFTSAKEAQSRQIELEGEYLSRHTDPLLRSTRLTETQVAIAEAAFLAANTLHDVARLELDEDLHEVIRRRAALGGEVLDFESCTGRVMFCEPDYGPGGIVTFDGELHVRNLCHAAADAQQAIARRPLFGSMAGPPSWKTRRFCLLGAKPGAKLCSL